MTWWSAGVVARVGAALAVFVSGLVHLQLYFDGYRDFPNENLGRSFVLNAAASVMLAILLLFRREAIVRIASALLLAGTLNAFALSRTDNGIFGFTERGLNPGPQATLALVVELVGLVLLSATFLPGIGPGAPIPKPPATAAAGLALAVAIGGSILWAQQDEPVPPSASPAETISSTTTTASTTTIASIVTPAPSETNATPSTSEVPTSASRVTTTVAPSTTVAATTPTTTTTTSTPNEPDATGQVVRIVDFAFDSPMLEVPVGTTVEWVNEDSFAHSVVADDRSFESEDMEPGDRYTFTFTTPGDFPYICGIHPSMQGVIVVTK